jgi:hypothetical protein
MAAYPACLASSTMLGSRSPGSGYRCSDSQVPRYLQTSLAPVSAQVLVRRLSSIGRGQLYWAAEEAEVVIMRGLPRSSQEDVTSGLYHGATR